MLLLFFFSFCIHPPIQSDPIKKYKVVIDPGHGGVKQSPMELFGDKYDSISKRFLEHYKNGTSYKKLTEMEVVMDLGKEVSALLELTQTKKGFEKFKTYIKMFSDTDAPWIKIVPVLSRKENYKDRKFREKDDKNADYRMYDFKDFATGKKRLGRLSKINLERPHLVVSLHINSMAGEGVSGMGVVLAPSYRTFADLKKISERKLDPDEFTKSPWGNWMRFQNNWTHLENAMSDAWIYFHGYWATKEGSKTDLKRFEGYRQNMVTWKYTDKAGWEKNVGKPGPYAKKHEDFSPIGSFWEREKDIYEKYRREDGIEGFGGDNFYAGTELLKFVQYGLQAVKYNDNYKYDKPGPIGRPFISTYSLPTYINAISAYLELGEIGSDRDMYFLTEKKKKVAICIAVGIYSLFNGLKLKPLEAPYTPKGMKLDLNKYKTKNGGNYFYEVVEGN